MNTLESIYLTEKVIKSIRSFFVRRKFQEVQTPLLYADVPHEPTIHHLKTVWHRNKNRIPLNLASSPEKGLKQMLSLGMGNCFAVSKSFRDLEDGGKQNLPEFTMLEWYRKGADYEKITRDVKDLVVFVSKFISKSLTLKYNGQAIDLSGKWPRYSFAYLFKEFLKTDYHTALQNSNLFKLGRQKDYLLQKKTTWEQVFHQLFLNEIYPHLPFTPYFLTDFPSLISPLCKRKKNDPLVAERFELFIGGLEIANGNTENTDWQTIEKEIGDDDFSASLRRMNHLKQSFAGVGFGIERFIMILTDTTNIKDIVFTPLI